MLYLLQNLVISAAKVLGIIDPQPRRIETTLPLQTHYTNPGTISLYSSTYTFEQPKIITTKPFPLYRQISAPPPKSAFLDNLAIGGILRNQYGDDLFKFRGKLYPTDSHLYRLIKFKANSQESSTAIISSYTVKTAIPAVTSRWYYNILSSLFPTSWQNTTNPSPTLAIQDSPALPFGFKALFNSLVRNIARSFFISNQSPQASAPADSPTLAIQNEAPVLPVENVQTEATVPAVTKGIISYSNTEIYDLLKSPEVLQEMLSTGQLIITPLTTEPPEGAFKAFTLSLSGYKTTGLLSKDINGTLSFKVGNIVIPLQYIKQSLIPTESSEDDDEDLIEVTRGENIDEENSRASRRSVHDDTTLEDEEITATTSRRLLFSEENNDEFSTYNNKLKNLSEKLIPPIKDSLTSLLKHVENLIQEGEDPKRLTEILELTDALITSEPGEDRRVKLAEYHLAAKSMHSNSHFKWQALGAAMLILGASILALGVGIIFTTPATVAGALLTAGGTGLMLASAGIFASNRKNISSSMTKLATTVENQDDEFGDDEDYGLELV